MIDEIWTLRTRIARIFSLPSETTEHSFNFLNNSLKSLQLSSTESKEYYELSLDFTLKGNGDKTDIDDMINQGIDILNSYLNYISFIIGKPLDYTETISFTHSLGGNKYRSIFLGEKKDVVSPIRINKIPLGDNMYENDVIKILHFMHIGLRETNPTFALPQLFMALEIISKDTAVERVQERICKKCGNHEILLPSSREKAVAYLVSTNIFDKKSAGEVWQSRIELVHGIKISTFRRHQEMSAMKSRIYRALALGIKSKLHIDNSHLPSEISNSIFTGTPILDIEYTNPKSP